MKELTIGELASYAGIETSAIRYYESEGLLPAPKRISGNRRYNPNVLKRLGLIQLLRQASFGIREIQALFNNLNDDEESPTPWQTVATAKIAELDAIIEQSQATRAWLAEALANECESAEDCIALTYDESGDGMEVTLSCIDLTTRVGKDPDTSFKLITMPSAFKK